MRFLTAPAKQQEVIDQILGLAPRPPAPEEPSTKGPLLLRVKDAAELLGVHRATIWRLVKAGRLGTVELLGSLRIRRADIEGLAAGHPARGHQAAGHQTRGRQAEGGVQQ